MGSSSPRTPPAAGPLRWERALTRGEVGPTQSAQERRGFDLWPSQQGAGVGGEEGPEGPHVAVGRAGGWESRGRGRGRPEHRPAVGGWRPSEAPSPWGAWTQPSPCGPQPPPLRQGGVPLLRAHRHRGGGHRSSGSHCPARVRGPGRSGSAWGLCKGAPAGGWGEQLAESLVLEAQRGRLGLRHRDMEAESLPASLGTPGRPPRVARGRWWCAGPRSPPGWLSRSVACGVWRVKLQVSLRAPKRASEGGSQGGQGLSDRPRPGWAPPLLLSLRPQPQVK